MSKSLATIRNGRGREWKRGAIRLAAFRVVLVFVFLDGGKKIGYFSRKFRLARVKYFLAVAASLILLLVLLEGEKGAKSVLALRTRELHTPENYFPLGFHFKVTLWSSIR